MKGHPELFPFFFGTWVVLGILGFWLFFLSEDVARRKRLRPVFIIGIGVLFVVLGFLMGGSSSPMAIVIPGVALITLLNLHLIRICESCGRTFHNANWLSDMKICSRCRKRLP